MVLKGCLGVCWSEGKKYEVKVTLMGVDGEGGDVMALSRNERSSLTETQVHLGEEEKWG